MITPNGRFATSTRLCLSMSDFHPGTWNPAWSVSTILTALLSFMCIYQYNNFIVEDTSTTGSIETSSATKKQLAKSSLEFNRSNLKFRQVFPDLAARVGVPTPVTPAISQHAPIISEPLPRSYYDWRLLFFISLFLYLIIFKIIERS